MSRRMLDAMTELRGVLRHEPLPRLLRGTINGEVVVRTTRALLVWEPRRVIPSYAVPEEDIRGQLVPAAVHSAAVPDGLLHPGIEFAAHSTSGVPLDLVTVGRTVLGAAFDPDDHELAGHILFDFHAFDGWLEEDVPVVAHPRDPFHRVDVLPSTRRVRIERDGVLLAETRRPTFVFETGLPMRTYVPRADVVVELRSSDRVSHCAYKGRAGYLTPVVDGAELTDVVWTYEDPLAAASGIAGLLAFFDDEVDVVVDGAVQRAERTELAASIADELARVPGPRRSESKTGAAQIVSVPGTGFEPVLPA